MLGIYVNEAQRSLTGVDLGDVPNDFEAGSVLCYLPVRQGWIYGYPTTGPDAGIPAERAGLGQDAGAAGAAAAAGSAEAVQGLVRIQRIQMALSMVSTLSIAAIAVLAVGRAIRDSRSGRPLIGE